MNLSIKYQENKEKITNIVKKHFGYADETKDLFEKIYNDKINYIGEDYQKFLNGIETSDFKVRRVVPEEIMEKLDSGFVLFKLYFSSFVKYYNVTYNNFRDWKIEINKNMFKLQKALTNYYSDSKNKIHFASDVQCIRSVEEYKSYTYSETDISRKLREIQERVSERKLPSSNLEVVITWDFADWFLCSSGESWTSCLNLDSGYDACFWHGLPALTGDPNRCMVYMTNGQKKKWNGIEADKVIARAWGILGEDGIIYLNKSYPTKNFSAEDVHLIFPEFEFGSIEDLTNQGRTKFTKYHITPFWMPNNYSDFIYSDLSIPRKDKRIEIGSGGGHYVFFKDIRETSGVTSEHHFHFNTGLSSLIERDIDIISAGGHRSLKKCMVCGKITSSMKRTEEGFICDSCYSKLPACSYCGNRMPKEKMMEFEGKLYCKSCFTSRFSVCELCGKKALKEEFSSSDKKVCKSCFNKFYFKCGACSSQTRIDRMKMIKNKVYCESCSEEAKR